MSFELVTNNQTTILPFAPLVRTTSDAVDMELLNSFAEIQPEDGSDLIVELIDLYLEDAPQRILAIRQAAAANEWAPLRRAAHNLRGSSANLGVRLVAGICEKLERADGHEPKAGVTELVRRLKFESARANETLVAERRLRCA